MNAAVFADVHGRGALCFDLCARWQQHTGEPIDLIMQAGDFGAFPERARLDSATRRYARRDRTELGFMYHFVGITPEIDALLAKTDAPLVFVRGNHEDHEWLDRLETASREAIFQVDVYGRVFCLKTGAPYTFEARGDTLRIMGIGRITPRSRRRAATSVDIQPYERRRLKRNEHEPVDILLTHDRAAEPGTNGMTEIRDYLALRRPAYHSTGMWAGRARSTRTRTALPPRSNLPTCTGRAMVRLRWALLVFCAGTARRTITSVWLMSRGWQDSTNIRGVTHPEGIKM
ncbi:MAG: metallophosphoesterase [Chloroflexi bacterium]|nr:metallophosphoesterase [Chloroflexota bacterium]